MKKIFALLLAMLFVFSAFMLASCDKQADDDGEDGDGETSKIDYNSLTDKQLFGVTLLNAVVGDEVKIPTSVPTETKDFTVNFGADIKKLTFEGQDIIGGKTASADFTVKADMDKKLVSVAGNASIMGDSLSIEAIAGLENVYITDLLGVNSKPIKFSMSDLGIDIDESMIDQAMAESDKMIKELATAINSVIEAVTKTVEKNLPDSAFVTEVKDVTVDGKEFKGAKVITLTVDAATAQAIAKDVLTAIGTNQTIIDLIGDGYAPTEEEINSTAEQFTEGLKEIKLVNTVANNETVQFVGSFTAENGETDSTFTAHCTFVDGNDSIVLGFTDANGTFLSEEGVLYLDHTLSGENETLTLKLDEDGYVTTMLEMIGTYKNGKRDATLTVNADGQKVAIDFTLEGDSKSGKLTVDKITVTSQGTTMSIDLGLSVEYTITSSKVSYKVGIKFAMDGVDVDMSMDVSVTTGEVSLSEPTNAMKPEEIDENTLNSWSEKLMNKIPNILKFVEDMNSNNNATPDYDDYYGTEGYAYAG